MNEGTMKTEITRYFILAPEEINGIKAINEK